MMIPFGAVDQYIRIVAYLLGILFCLMLGFGARARRLRWVFLLLAGMLGVQLGVVFARTLGALELSMGIQAWCLTPALVLVVVMLARGVRGIGLEI